MWQNTNFLTLFSIEIAILIPALNIYPKKKQFVDSGRGDRYGNLTCIHPGYSTDTDKMATVRFAGCNYNHMVQLAGCNHTRDGHDYCQK